MPISKNSLIQLLIKTGIVPGQTEAEALLDAQEEKEVSIPETTKLFTGDAYSKLTENLKNEGIKIGKDLAVKDLKEKAGLDFEGKNPDKFIEEFKSAMLKEGGKSVDEQVKKVKEELQQVKDALKVKSDEVTKLVNEKTEIAKDAKLLSLLPKNRDDRFTDQQYLLLVKSEFEITEEEGKEVIKRKGQVVKDDTFNPIEPSKVLSSHFEQSKWIKEQQQATTPGGRGAGSQLPKDGMFLNIKEFNKHLESQNIHPGSEKATKLLQEAMTKNPEMDLSLS